MVRGEEFHSIIYSIFDGDVKGLYESEQVQANCPRCQEREGLSQPDGKYNLEINTAKRVYRCWKCDEPKFSGSLGRLIKIFGRDSDYALYKSYAGQFIDYTISEDEKEFDVVTLPNEYIPFSRMEINNPLHLEAYNYMVLNRQIEFKKLIEFNIGFCIEGDYFGRIIIPSYDKFGDLNYFVARSYRNIKPPYQNPDVNKSKIIFNESHINWDSTVFIVEGVFEMLRLPNSIPLLGKDIGEHLFFKIKEKQPNLIIALDKDAFRSELELYKKLSVINKNTRILNFNSPYAKDIDELICKNKKSELLTKLYASRTMNENDYFYGVKYYNSFRKKTYHRAI